MVFQIHVVPNLFGEESSIGNDAGLFGEVGSLLAAAVSRAAGKTVADGQGGGVRTKVGALVGVAAIVLGCQACEKPSDDRRGVVVPSTSVDAPHQSAAATAGPPPVVSRTAPGGSGTSAPVAYIEDLEATPDSDPYDSRDVAEISGRSYDHSQGAQFCFGSNQRKWTYVLGRRYVSLKAVLGLGDSSVSTAVVRFEIVADGNPVYSRDLRVGDSVDLDLPVRDVLQVQLTTVLLTEDGGCGAATAEWANVRAET